MGIPIFGINIPAPKIKISNPNLEKYADLYRGIRDRKDTVSWRTLIITIRTLLGETNPDQKKINKRNFGKTAKLIKQLVGGTYLEPLTMEIEFAVGVTKKNNSNLKHEIDFLLFSGRHYPEGLLWSVADYLKSKGKNVAVINPVGHYNDGQTRVIGPFKYFHKINKVIIISSTQHMAGGSVSVLSNVIKLLRNTNLSSRVNKVEVVIPMFGGSRGHRFGQSQEVGYEVMEAGFNAQVLSLVTKDVLQRLGKEIPKVPVVRFSSIDIHNGEYPATTFNEYGFDFSSISSSFVLAKGLLSLLKSQKIKTPLKLIACDKGAIPRTQNLAKSLVLDLGKSIKDLQIIYLEKKRLTAGTVSAASISKIEEWKKDGTKIKIKEVKVPSKPSFAHTTLVYSDDMIDTGGTAEKDLNFISSVFPNSSFKIFAATHPVFSKGFGAIKRIGADAYVLGNTLSWEGIDEIKGVEIVDFAEAVYEEILR